MNDAKKIFRSFRFGSKGLCHAYAVDKSFRMEINYGLPVYLVLGFILSPFEHWELFFFVFSYFFILVIELVNTAFEKMFDTLHPEEHELIRRSKDIAAGAVLMAFVFAAIVIFALFVLRYAHGVHVAPLQFFV